MAGPRAAAGKYADQEDASIGLLAPDEINDLLGPAHPQPHLLDGDAITVEDQARGAEKRREGRKELRMICSYMEHGT